VAPAFTVAASRHSSRAASCLREALLNSLIHRDYMIPAPIQIRVYAHKLMIWNPATLPEGWTENNLLAPHNSRPLNPDIANTLGKARVLFAEELDSSVLPLRKKNEQRSPNGINQRFLKNAQGKRAASSRRFTRL
jgi:hypothetical protein